MAKTSLARPTDTELDILRVLWQRGPSTVREVQETLNAAKPTGYTTVLKMLQIMTDKGLVRRDERQRAHVYEARLAREQTQQQLVTDLLERVFEGSATGLVMHALTANRRSSEQELAKIRRMLEEFEQGEQ
ncbi:MAG TPA: BlaI/MecI/CopY family transcriptional regulator [Blastocatellia bacterium]|nr:BlaI/MecI/CopY family transcriptional regulator [Blastocatellia bacterium]